MAAKKKNAEKTTDFDEAMETFPHFKNYIEDLGRHPEWLLELPRGRDYSEPDFIYPVGDPIFIHIYKDEKERVMYHVIEPRLNEEEQDLYNQVIDKLVSLSYKQDVPDEVTDIGPVLLDLLDDVITTESSVKNLLNFTDGKIRVTETQYKKIRYYLIRNRVGYSKLQPLFYDPYLEDIHCTGVGNIKTQHKRFDMVYTNITFKDDEELDSYILDVTERVERPVSDAHPVVDSMMPDGSRANFLYSREISKEGSSFTLRKFTDTPISITQIVDWGTLSPDLAGYIWLALENGMNLFVCGETASGKTTTLNAISAFIPPDDKVYTVENTPEVTMPHDVWQHLVTRESGKDSDVDYEELLEAALRSRPDYIIVGEIRGVEGSIAFQAMQCIKDGHIVIPGKGPVDIQELFEQSKEKHGSDKDETKETVPLKKENIPVLVSEKDGYIKTSSIENIFKMNEEKLVKIVMDTGEILEVTPNHKFITTDNEEILAEDILKGQKPELLLPKHVPWKEENITGYAFLKAKKVEKPITFKSVWDQYKNKGEYTTVRKQHEETFKKRTKTIPFSLLTKMYKETSTSLPKKLHVVRKGAKQKICVERTIPSSKLRSAGKRILGEKTPHDTYLEHILGVTPTNIEEQFWKLGKKQLRDLYQSLPIPEVKQTKISDDLWYCIGRLAGDDSLYVTRNKDTDTFKDFRWQIKNANRDEGKKYAEDAKNILPHTAENITTKKEGETYTTRICCIDRSFIDYLCKQGFIQIDEDCNWSKAVKKKIPSNNIGNPYAYLAGLLDSDATIREKKKGYEVTLALNRNAEYKKLLETQLALLKEYEGSLLPKILKIDFRYSKNLEKEVKYYEKVCEEKGFETRKKVYNKQEGIGIRAEFSTNTKQDVFKVWNKEIKPYMYREDKKEAIQGLAKRKKKDGAYTVKNRTYPQYTTKVHENVIPHLSLLSQIFGKTLVKEEAQLHREQFIRIETKQATKPIHVERTPKSNTYDISMEEGTYYIGGKKTMSYTYDTGHPVMSTFHAGNVTTMIQRMTGEPINVPITFIDNLNLVLIQQAVNRKGEKLRRVLSLTELERYYEPDDAMVTREVVTWDPATDIHNFRGMYNSYILEQKIAKMLGYADTRKIYDVMKKRSHIIERMIEEEILDYYDVWDTLQKYYYSGEDGLPFKI